MKSNKGFTLIELLAVIVILAIIALIATPTILGVIETARKGSAESSALGYIDAVEKQVAIDMLDTANAVVTIPENGRYDVTINFPHNTSPYESDDMWLCITEKDVGFVPYGTPVAPTSKGIYRQALGFRWGVKNNTSEPQYINYESYGTYKRLNPGATLFKIDASDDYGWSHYMIFEGSLAQYFTQKYSFDYNSSTKKIT